MDAGAQLQAEARRRPADLLRSPDRALGAVEDRDEAVASGRHLAAAESVEPGADGQVVAGQQIAPGALAELPRAVGRAHDVGHEQRGHDTVVVATLVARERGAGLAVDRYPRLVTVDPGVMPGRDLVELVRLDKQLSAIAHLDAARPGDRVADVVVLAPLGAGDRFDR